MRNNLRAITLLVLALAVFSTNAHAQQDDALRTNEFCLIKREFIPPLWCDKVEAWLLCLREYPVLISTETRYIPVFPVYSECCFKNQRHRAVDVLERASNALDALLHEEHLEVLFPPVNGNFRGSSIWTVPADRRAEHPGLVFRIDEKDVDHFGSYVSHPPVSVERRTEYVARYVMEIFSVMRTLFLKLSDPSDSGVVENYPEVKILKRIWLDARQHVENELKVPADKSAERVRHRDIQEAIDMLSESQRLRLLGIALMIPVKR